MVNISKKRLWSKPGENSPYHIYYLSKKQRGDYLNVWFPDKIIITKGVLYRDALWTIKKVDDKTANQLYSKNINPICVWIGRSYKEFKKDKHTTLCSMKAIIYSIDDSSYGIWWDSLSYDILKEIRMKVLAWVDSFEMINGEEFLQFCITLGADKESIDYN